MRIYDIIKENTTSSSIATVNASGMSIQKRNPDGTAVNALDQNENIFGKRRKKKDESDQSSTNGI